MPYPHSRILCNIQPLVQRFAYVGFHHGTRACPSYGKKETRFRRPPHVSLSFVIVLLLIKGKVIFTAFLYLIHGIVRTDNQLLQVICVFRIGSNTDTAAYL